MDLTASRIAVSVVRTDFDDSNLPQEVNRDTQAISFTKGCYLGQETVARIDALGHVNKKLVIVSLMEGDTQIRNKIASRRQEGGTITTSGWSPRTSRPAALAMVKREANDLGSELESPVGKAVVVAASGERIEITSTEFKKHLASWPLRIREYSSQLLESLKSSPSTGICPKSVNCCSASELFNSLSFRMRSLPNCS